MNNPTIDELKISRLSMYLLKVVQLINFMVILPMHRLSVWVP